MKNRITLVCTLVLLATISFAFTSYNPSPEYFEGKWNVLVKFLVTLSIQPLISVDMM